MTEFVVGIGMRRGVGVDEILAVVREFVGDNTIRCFATVDRRAAEPGLTAAAATLGVPIVSFTPAELAAIEVPNPSQHSLSALGTPSVAEAAAILAGRNLVLPRRSRRGVVLAAADTEPTGDRARDGDSGEPASTTGEKPWRASTLVAFRFCFVYFVLYCLGFAQILFVLLGVLVERLPDRAALWQMQRVGPMVEVVARHVLGVEVSLHADSGSGDQGYMWVLLCCWLIIALVVTVGWSVLDRRRRSYPTLLRWFHVFLRFCLAGQMFFYGFAKVVPLQMHLQLTTLVEPFGNLSPMNVLWSQVGASQPYEIATGCAEVLGGLLLVVARSATLGALVSAVALGQVLLLNLTYDVPVKIHSSHLLLMSLVLLAPEAGRLAAVFLSNRAVGPPRQRPLFRGRRANRVAVVMQVVFGLWIAGSQLQMDWKLWSTGVAASRDTPLYGIWNVTDFAVDQRPIAPSTTETTRWRRLVVEFPGAVSIQRMDDSFDGYQAAVDVGHRTLTLTNPADPRWTAALAFDKPAPDRLTLAGDWGGHPVQIGLARLDLETLPLIGRGFHWVQDYPYQR